MSWVAVDVYYEGCGTHTCIVDHVYGPFDTEELAKEAAMSKISKWRDDWRVIEMEAADEPDHV